MFLDGAACQLALTVGGDAVSVAVAIAIAVLAGGRGRGDVWDLFGVGVLAADLGDADVTSFAGLGEGVVAAVEVLALLRPWLAGMRMQMFRWPSYLQLVLEQVFLVGQLAVETEELGLLLRHFLNGC